MGRRIDKFIINGKMYRLPLVTLSKMSTDYYINYDSSVDRMDSLSSKYYNDPSYGWLIMLANQEYGSLEYEIPTGSILRIPFPLSNALSDYDAKVESMLKNKNITR